MKKSVPILLTAVLFLTACGTPSAEPSPSPVPVESAEPADTAESAAPLELPDVPNYYTQPRQVPEWLDFPDDGFTVEGYYLAEPFGVCGRALLLTGTDEDGNARFKCRYVSYALEYNEPFGLQYFLHGACVDDSSARLEERPEGAVELLDAPPVADGVWAPGVFYPVRRDEALRAYRDMPCVGEAELPLDRHTWMTMLDRMENVNQTGELTYEYRGVYISCESFWTGKSGYIRSFSSAEPGAPLSVRGLRIGESTLADALAAFPYMYEEYSREMWRIPLYGSVGGLRGELTHSDQGLPCIVLEDNDSFMRLSFDENEVLSAVFWSTSEFDGQKGES